MYFICFVYKPAVIATGSYIEISLVLEQYKVNKPVKFKTELRK